MRRLFCLAALALHIAVTSAVAQPVLDLPGLPTLSPSCRQLYAEKFLISNTSRVFAIADNGHCGFSTAAKSLEAARASALEFCAKAGGTRCQLYAEDLSVVWPGRVSAPNPPPSPSITGRGYEFVPDVRFIWHGPQAARGVYVWSHGRGATDARGLQPQAHVRFFNNAGFDIIRFDRELGWDEKDRAAGWLRDGLQKLRASGYRMVVAGGQSRGAWNSLQMLDTPGLADVVIAVSPAAHGTETGSVALRQGPELWHILHDARSPKTRVAVVQFRDDPYADDEDERADKFGRMLFPGIAAGLLIDRPDGFKGHGAGAESGFAQSFGACLFRFATEMQPPPACIK